MTIFCRLRVFKKTLSVTSVKNFRKEIVMSKLVFRSQLYSTSVSGDKFSASEISESKMTGLPNQPISSGLSIGDILNMNIDEKDISRHDNITDWWNPNGPMMGLHAMNDLRIGLIRCGLENSGRLKVDDIKSNPQYFTGIKVIEVGCGAGILCEPLARLGADVTGIDPGLEVITAAKTHAAENAHTLKSAPVYINTTIEEHSLNISNMYDVVVASEVIEHVPDKRIFLDACIKTLKPGGSIFLTTPNRTTASWLGSIVIAENILKLLPKGIHSWDKFITPIELKQLLKKLGCQTVLINGMMFNVLNRSWSWCSSMMFHYAIHAIKSNTAQTPPTSSTSVSK